MTWWARVRLAFGFDDETFVATAGFDVDATSTAPRDGNGLAAGFEVVLGGCLHLVFRSGRCWRSATVLVVQRASRGGGRAGTGPGRSG